MSILLFKVNTTLRQRNLRHFQWYEEGNVSCLMDYFERKISFRETRPQIWFHRLSLVPLKSKLYFFLHFCETVENTIQSNLHVIWFVLSFSTYLEALKQSLYFNQCTIELKWGNRLERLHYWHTVISRLLLFCKNNLKTFGPSYFITVKNKMLYLWIDVGAKIVCTLDRMECNSTHLLFEIRHTDLPMAIDKRLD